MVTWTGAGSTDAVAGAPRLARAHPASAIEWAREWEWVNECKCVCVCVYLGVYE